MTASSLPSVALAIPTHNGSSFLSECLDSVAALDYPRELLQTIVVDNASSDSTPALLANSYPWVRVLRQSRNLGFAEAVDVVARSSQAECLAVANDDMRFDALWLRELVAAYDPSGGYSCVGGLILDITGEHLDFGDSYIAFDGWGGPLGYGSATTDVPIVDGRDLPFACGGSLLVDRRLFLELGGFDPAFFAYLEDVDFGWRLWLAGHRVRLAANARSYHHHSGTGLKVPAHQRMVLYERNALLTLLKNVGEKDLYRFLASALCLVAERARIATQADPQEFEFGAFVERMEREVPLRALARLYGVSGFVAQLEETLAKRELVQTLRRRSDDEIFAVFGRPFRPIYTETSYLEAVAAIARVFGIVERFPRRRLTRLLYVAPAESERSRELARSLARVASVLQVAEGKPTGMGIETIELKRADLRTLARESDALVVRSGDPASVAAARLARGIRPLIVDVDDDTPATDATVGDAALVLCSTPAARERWTAALARPVEVIPDGGSDDALRLFVEEPWRAGVWQEMTEDIQALAELRRNPPPPASPTPRGVGRRVWRRVPQPVRERLRPIVRRFARQTRRSETPGSR